MKILLFGGSGMVGKELSLALAGHTVVAPLHSQVDITDSAAIERLVAAEKPDFVINAAAIINVDKAEENPELARQINALGAESIARAAARAQRRLVYISTNYVFGDEKSGYVEEDSVSPLNVYGKTKAEGEALVAGHCKEAGIPYHIIRTSWLYSAVRNTAVDFFAQSLVSGKTVDASLELGNPTHAGDLASAIVTNFIEGKQESGIFHLINEPTNSRGGVSRVEVARTIAHMLDIPQMQVREVSETTWFKAPRPKAALLRNTKLPPLRSWEEALRSYILYQYAQEKEI